MTTANLYESAQVQLDASGNGTAKVGPLSARETWNPAAAHVQVSSATNEAQCTIYVGSDTSQSSFRDATFTGSSGDSTSRVSGDTVRCGTYVWAVWQNGDPGANAVLNVTGSKNV